MQKCKELANCDIYFHNLRFDSQFIIIQRYNRPRIIKLLEKENKKEKKVLQ